MSHAYMVARILMQRVRLRIENRLADRSTPILPMAQHAICFNAPNTETLLVPVSQQSHRGMEIPCLLLQYRHRKIKVPFMAYSAARDSS